MKTPTIFYFGNYLTTVGNCSTVKRKMVAKLADNPNFPISAKTVAASWKNKIKFILKIG